MADGLVSIRKREDEADKQDATSEEPEPLKRGTKAYFSRGMDTQADQVNPLLFS
jgi:hypothetical protein